MAEAWPYLFPDTPLPETIGVTCCAQFVVTKQQILARPKEDYQRIYNWLMTTSLEDQVSGRVMEFVWHIIFGQDPYQ